ncbi:MAG TPA: KpsF/GutQ family sugar-phosphate isomerase [bacterium]|nr:KpsF/GutQ family sugar-phosphate isomerase [bacterium]HQG45861.1 KpsF/GutQ family sugar-phosphate isomerase [bacterium]HQI47221.1 KpsF/GutQ family sugar-phosphate isomerase [bacterium]HQJ65153.1 KpsF/GutQ family sugar-phosphate isomerase [bacterium]
MLRIESEAIAGLIPKVGEGFTRAVELILNCKGRVIITGLGKSGIVGKKIAATLTSTGTSAYFLHPVEAVHGDLGMVLKNDVVICISKSGNTDEITNLFPMLKEIGVPVITLTGNMRSALAQRSDVVLDVSVAEEACPLDLAPTASTTATMAMGDALAVALLKKRDFGREEFAFLHPGGTLGKKLLRISELMFTGEHIPAVRPGATLREVIFEITRKRFGCTCVVDEAGKLAGLITDGDLRRTMQDREDLRSLRAGDFMNPAPKTISPASRASQALEVMKQYNILQIVVVDETRHPVGMLHLHDLLEAGIGS